MRKLEWSKAFIVRPRDNIISHVMIKAPRFTPSFEKNDCPVPMSWLLGWEYARIWLRERDAYITKRNEMNKPKHINNDYSWWLKKRVIKARKSC